MVENSPSLARNLNRQIQQANKTQTFSFGKNPKKSTPSNIIIKLLKTKDKEKNLEGSQRKTTLSVGEKTV